MLTVKPYPEESAKGIGWLFRGNIEYYIQRWQYEGEMTVEDFFEAFRDPERVKELLATPTQRIIYDNWGDNVESWTLYNLTKDRFYWDGEGHCLFDLFKFCYSAIQGTFEGYWYEAEEAIALFKQFCEIHPADEMTYYSTIWGGAPTNAPLLVSQSGKLKNTEGYPLTPTREEHRKTNLEAVKGKTLHNAPLNSFSPYTGMRYNPERFLYKTTSKWFLDWEDEWFKRDPGRNDLSIFHNHTQKTFMIMAFRESEYMLSALRDKGL
jgi:hypothetical protein